MAAVATEALEPPLAKSTAAIAPTLSPISAVSSPLPKKRARPAAATPSASDAVDTPSSSATTVLTAPRASPPANGQASLGSALPNFASRARKRISPPTPQRVGLEPLASFLHRAYATVARTSARIGSAVFTAFSSLTHDLIERVAQQKQSSGSRLNSYSTSSPLPTTRGAPQPRTSAGGPPPSGLQQFQHGDRFGL